MLFLFVWPLSQIIPNTVVVIHDTEVFGNFSTYCVYDNLGSSPVNVVEWSKIHTTQMNQATNPTQFYSEEL